MGHIQPTRVSDKEKTPNQRPLFSCLRLGVVDRVLADQLITQKPELLTSSPPINILVNPIVVQSKRNDRSGRGLRGSTSTIGR